MRRVLVIGCGGAGKTTFSLELADITGLPVVHLDAHFWRPGWVRAPNEEWLATVADLTNRDAWIMDGNYGGTLERRLRAADTVVFLDLPRLVCITRVIRRRFRYGGQTRASLPLGCPERITPGFLHWIWTYPSRRRGQILERLAELESSKRVLVLRSQREVDEYLDALRRGAG